MGPEDYISKLVDFMILFISNGTAKTKLAILAFFYHGEFAKNSIAGNICTNLYFL